MAKKGKKTKPIPANRLSIHPPAAGIEVGAAEPWVGVPADRAAQPVQKLSAFPCDLPRLADWCTACRMTTVGMASTGVSWIPLLPILAARGFAVALVNARHGTKVPGRPKPERFDCRGLQTLQPYGVLAPSVRPPEDRGQRRSLLRHREPWIRMTVKPLQPRHKSRDQMPLPLPHVMRDIPGVTGLRIIRARVAGERDPHPFAQYRASRMPSSADTIAKALAGDDRAAQVFTLPPSLALSAVTPQHIAACDQDIERVLAPLDAPVDPDEPPFPPPTPPQRHPQRHEPACDLRTHLSRLTGVDLTHVPGFPAPTSHILLAAVGLKRHPWPTDQPGASWRGLCPENQIRGGTGRATGRRRVHHRARRALRLAAPSLRTSPSSLGAFSRRMRSTLGPAKATTATAPTLAPMLSHMRKETTSYRERGAASSLHRDHERTRQQ
jgi:transposase